MAKPYSRALETMFEHTTSLPIERGMRAEALESLLREAWAWLRVPSDDAEDILDQAYNAHPPERALETLLRGAWNRLLVPGKEVTYRKFKFDVAGDSDGIPSWESFKQSKKTRYDA